MTDFLTIEYIIEMHVIHGYNLNKIALISHCQKQFCFDLIQMYYGVGDYALKRLKLSDNYIYQPLIYSTEQNLLIIVT
jgi:hypothetical protein